LHTTIPHQLSMFPDCLAAGLETFTRCTWLLSQASHGLGSTSFEVAARGTSAVPESILNRPATDPNAMHDMPRKGDTLGPIWISTKPQGFTGALPACLTACQPLVLQCFTLPCIAHHQPTLRPSHKCPTCRPEQTCHMI